MTYPAIEKLRHSGASRSPEVPRDPDRYRLDTGLHWKQLLRFQYFRHPWRSRRYDGI